MNDTTFQGNGKVAYVPVVVNAKPPKPTNADRLRSMTDEELAESRILCPYYDSEEDMCSKWVRDDGGRDCAACALDWLKQEVTANDS